MALQITLAIILCLRVYRRTQELIPHKESLLLPAKGCKF